MKIGVISDTHGLLRPEVLDALRDCECILHAGDINRPEILERLTAIAPVKAVRGNNDREWAEGLPLILRFELGGMHFLMTHIKKDVPADLTGIDAVIYGHSHKYAEQTADGRLWLNPGSCGKRRFDQEITFAILTIDTEGAHVRKMTVPHPGKEEKK